MYTYTKFVFVWLSFGWLVLIKLIFFFCLVFQEVVLQLLKETMIKKAAHTKCFLIDGYPRELQQGKQFECEVGKDFFLSLFFFLSYYIFHNSTFKKLYLKMIFTLSPELWIHLLYPLQIEPWSPRLLVNTLLTRPMAWKHSNKVSTE